MTGKDGHDIEGSKLCPPPTPPTPTKCGQNIIQFIRTHGPYDFIALQEASAYQDIFNDPTMANYEVREQHHNKGNEFMVTAWDETKYKLDPDNNFYSGWFGSNFGRPFHIFFFYNKLCFINVHPGHGPNPAKGFSDDSINVFEQSVYIAIKNNEAVKQKFKDYKIIIAGDFNNNLSGPIKFLGRDFKGQTTEPTCCDLTLNDTLNPKMIKDHIIHTSDIVKKSNEVGKPGPLHSDHLPVIATLQLN